MPFSRASLAPIYILFPLISMPKKFFSGNIFPKPTAYSPLPQPSSSTMGLLFLKISVFHLPFNGKASEKGASVTFGNLLISEKRHNLSLPIIL